MRAFVAAAEGFASGEVAGCAVAGAGTDVGGGVDAGGGDADGEAVAGTFVGDPAGVVGVGVGVSVAVAARRSSPATAGAGWAFAKPNQPAPNPARASAVTPTFSGPCRSLPKPRFAFKSRPTSYMARESLPVTLSIQRGG